LCGWVGGRERESVTQRAYSGEGGVGGF
jgi:hypothetical protein